MKKTIVCGLVTMAMIAWAGQGFCFVGPKSSGSQSGSGQDAFTPVPPAINPDQCPTCPKSKVINKNGKTYIVSPDGKETEIKVK